MRLKPIKNKLDIWVQLFVLATFIPILCNTYISLGNTIYLMLSYMVGFIIYLFFREITKKYPKMIKAWNIIAILFTIGIILLGIDMLTTNISSNIFPIIKILSEYSNGENRLASIFNYSNVVAAIIASVLFLNIGECLEQKSKKKKAIYQTITFVFLVGIILTYSKGVFIILPVLMAVYLYVMKEKRIEISINIFFSFMMALIYTMAFEKIIDIKSYWFAWILLFIFIIINYIINRLLQKLVEVEVKIDKKKVIISSVSIIVFMVVYFIIGLTQIEPYDVFPQHVEKDYDAKIVNHIQGNQSYLFEFELEAEAPKDMEIYTINLLERDEKNQEVNSTSIQFGTYVGQKQIELITKQQTREIKIEFISKYQYGSKYLTIKNLKINQKEIPLKYKYLPTKLVEKVKNISIHYKTATERIEMIKNALELSKQNLLTGSGAKTWIYKYKEVQNYHYIVNELHSYPANIILETGMLGIISYIGIAVILIKILIKLLKDKNKRQLSILFAIFFIALHSIIDKDMEYQTVLFYIFILLGIISNNLEERKCKISNIIFIPLIFISGYFMLSQQQYSSYNNIVELTQSQNGLKASSQEYIAIEEQKIEKYQELLQYERYNLLQNYSKIVKSYIKVGKTETKEKLEQYITKIAEYENKNKYDIESITAKIEIVYSILQELEKKNNSQYDEITKKCIDIILEEYSQTLLDLKNCLSSQYIPIEENSTIERIQKIYESINQLKQNYLLGIRVINDTQIIINEEDLENIPIEINKKILIYHTHTSESYKSEEDYEMYLKYRTLNEKYNVIEIGNYLKQLLEEKNFTVKHDISYYDLPSTIGAYRRAKIGAKKILEENADINLVIDLHRDAYTEEEHVAPTIELNGKKTAYLRLVVGIDEKNENWMNNLKMAIQIQKVADEKYPGLFKKILVREESYHSEVAEYGILLEVGENCNTIEEAKNSIEIFAQILENVH